MIAWSVKPSEFEIKYEPRGPIKAHCLGDFLSKLHPPLKTEDTWWTLHVDELSNHLRSEVRIILEGSIGLIFEQSLKFDLSNNQIEYETLIADLFLAQ